MYEGNKTKYKDDNFRLLSRLSTNINFISGENPIFADFKNTICFWIKIINRSKTYEIYTSFEIF